MKQRSALPWLILGCVVVAALLAWWTLSRSFVGEAPSQLEHRDLASFHALDVGGSARIELVQGDANAIDIEATPAQDVRAHVTAGTLVVATRSHRGGFGFFRRKAPPAPRVTVTFRTLDTMHLHGAVRVEASKLDLASLRITATGGSKLDIDDLRAKTLAISGSGALDARIGGEVQTQTVEISGAGSYDAERLRAQDATVQVSGVGNVVVNVEQTLDAEISGAGGVEYLGNPRVTQHVSGIGRVKRREPAPSSGMRVDAGQCSAPSSPWFLKKSNCPVAASTSGWMPASTRTSPTRQSASSASSTATASPTLSVG
jgi:hypothetical protein